MDYELVHLDDKKVAGLKIRTNNFSENMEKDMGDMWQKFGALYYKNNAPNKTCGKSIGLYTNYAGDHQDDYDAYACYEVTSYDSLPEEFATTTIKGGNFAKFILKGEMHQIVSEFWSSLWNMPLDRTFQGDFEEYQTEDMKDAEIHFYISVK